ncbi:MAG: LytR C-terminal domain-containing protein, partial [Bacteroidota bacterium]
FDVVEMGNYKTSDVEETMVLDRAGNLEAAKQVAAAIGVPEEQVQQQIDKSLYLDVSVVIGKDFQRLKALQ